VDLNKLTGTKPMNFFTGVDGAGEQGGDSTTDDKDGGETPMFTGKELALYCEEIYANKSHWAYWYGTYGNMCTEAKYKSKKKQYPEHYGSSRTAGYMKDIELKRRCADCVGMIKSFFWTGNHYDTDPKYGTNGCPDKSANGLFKMCKTTGDIKTIPDIPGIVVWKDGHIGVYIGGGYTIEMRGFDYDCVKRKVKDGPWKKWGKLPMLSYDEPKPEPSEYGHVLVTGGSVNIRSAPGVKSKDIGTAHKGDLLVYQGVTQEADGKPWYLIIWENQNAWISSKYSKLVE
jgi:hypothetical protein